eukprot:6213520-Pyramimonas_sp.AAC.1
MPPAQLRRLARPEVRGEHDEDANGQPWEPVVDQEARQGEHHATRQWQPGARRRAPRPRRSRA